MVFLTLPYKIVVKLFLTLIKLECMYNNKFRISLVFKRAYLIFYSFFIKIMYFTVHHLCPSLNISEHTTGAMFQTWRLVRMSLRTPYDRTMFMSVGVYEWLDINLEPALVEVADDVVLVVAIFIPPLSVHIL